MTAYILAFWIALAIIFYAYVGYGILLYIIIRIKRFLKKKDKLGNILEDRDRWPKVTMVVAAYNEELFIKQKIENTFSLDYPKEKVQYLFVTDGSDDNTATIVSAYPDIRHFHQVERRGKIAAVNRIMHHIQTPIIIFSDANTMLNKECIKRIVVHYDDESVGAVSGEKRVTLQEKDSASASGESFYWRYESTLKKWDAELYSAVGAAGELFSIRTNLFEEVHTDTLIEDFFMTMKIAEKGYRIAYEPQAYAVETASATVAEERKRKIRISAGAFQAMIRLRALLNPFKHGLLSFQYISHRVLRWTLAPVSLFMLIPINMILALQIGGFYTIALIGQLIFYLLAILGWWMEKRSIRFKLLYIPYYFCMMNISVFQGLARYLKGNQSVVWERAQRKMYSS